MELYPGITHHHSQQQSRPSEAQSSVYSQPYDYPVGIGDESVGNSEENRVVPWGLVRQYN